MAVLTRVNRKEYPGAIVEVRNPFTCVAYPTIQALAKFLMESAQPSVIINGKLYTEESEGDITIACVV